MDGQPYCTPAAFWREGEHLYWHGSSASRMIRFQKAGVPVCVTVTHPDAQTPPPEMAPYREGPALDQVLTDAFRMTYPSDG